jgi:hypothetical protein
MIPSGIHERLEVEILISVLGDISPNDVRVIRDGVQDTYQYRLLDAYKLERMGGANVKSRSHIIPVSSKSHNFINK